MQQFIVFLSSDAGKLVSSLLTFVGMMDIVIAKFLIGKMVREAEDKISPALSPDQQLPLQNQLRIKQTLRTMLTITGTVFIILGLFGLTR